MTSTYTPNGGIQKPGSGDQSGSWGITANTNYDIIDTLINGNVSIALTTTTYTLLTSNGAVSEGQNLLIVFTGTPGGTTTISILPNTAEKIYFIKNESNQTITISQGSGATVSITAGHSKVVYSNGIGATSSVYDFTSYIAMSNVQITGGSITGITDLAITEGGTGASSAAAALTNLGGQGTITGAATTITTANLTVSRAVIANLSGKVDVSNTTDTELSYVSGVTSAIQTQLNAKAPSASPTLTTPTLASPTTTGTVTVNGGTASWTIVASGTNLTFSYGGVAKFRLTSGGAIVVSGDITAFGAP